MKKIKCSSCKKEMAVYVYMPNSHNNYYCENCVPRGCSCNHYSTRDEDYHPSGGIMPTTNDGQIKWIDEHTWCYIDEKGREYPCCEYMRDDEGFDKYPKTRLCSDKHFEQLLKQFQKNLKSFLPKNITPLLEKYGLQISQHLITPHQTCKLYNLKLLNNFKKSPYIKPKSFFKIDNFTLYNSESGISDVVPVTYWIGYSIEDDYHSVIKNNYYNNGVIWFKVYIKISNNKKQLLYKWPVKITWIKDEL